jgi:hypothetical protein
MTTGNPRAERSWQVILEQIRSQNHATIEAVESLRAALVQRLESVDEDSRARDSLLELAVRDLIEALARLESRVSALERRLA